MGDEPDPIEIAAEYHRVYGGKLATRSTVPLREDDLEYDLSLWYTPGVAEPCKAIDLDEQQVYEYTSKKNMIAVVSDGTRVLGLGDIGPHAGLPVMEGKSLLFDHLGGVNAVPVCVGTSDEDELVEFVTNLQPSFGGINLENIEKPKCFEVLRRCQEELDIPVLHDDQQGTGIVTLAGLYGALKVVGKTPEEIELIVNGAGAAGINAAKYAIVGRVSPENITLIDSTGILSSTRNDLEGTYKYEWAIQTNPEGIEGQLRDVTGGADALISLVAPGPGIVAKEDVEQMADDAIVFACANPVPEILPDDGKEAGARIVETGRSDYPNQINNSLGFPAVFRGALEVRASRITEQMCIAAAHAIAERAEEIGLSKDFVIPTMGDAEMYIEEAIAVAKEAIEEGVARRPVDDKELEHSIRETLHASREEMKILMEQGLIPPFPS